MPENGSRRVIHDAAEIGKPLGQGEQIEGRKQDHGIDGPGLEGREAGRGRAGINQVVIAVLQAIRNEHPGEIEAGDVLRPADHDRLALQILDALDRRLADQRKRRFLTFEPQQTDCRALLDGADRVYKRREPAIFNEPAASCCTSCALDCTDSHLTSNPSAVNIPSRSAIR